MLKYLLSMLLSAIIRSCSFHFRNSAYLPDSHFMSQGFPSLFEMFSRCCMTVSSNGLHVKTESSKKANLVKHWRYQEQDLPFCYRNHNFLPVPLETRKILSVACHWRPNTDEFCACGSTSSFSVLQICVKSSKLLHLKPHCR